MLEHQRFLSAGDDLNQLNQVDLEVFLRPYKRPKVAKIWREMSVSDLALSYQETLVRQRRKTKILKKETVSVAETIRGLGEVLEVGQLTDLRSLLGDNPSIPRVVVSFLAGLELSKLKKMRLHQNQTYDPIYLELLENIRAIRLELASDFDVENFNRDVDGAENGRASDDVGVDVGALGGAEADAGGTPGIGAPEPSLND
ncbi:MAG: hypothetical protein IT285_03775 [Bdellovibrionales bacterium]|nr:hypothetical protein [Bdellovibrionales bacterium]